MYQPKELYTPVKKKAPFNTGTKVIGLTTDPYLPKNNNKNKDNNCDNYLIGHVNLPGQLIDAETNEPLEISRATWNVREGRINLNAKTILDMGTGRLDIKNRVLDDNNIRYNHANSSSTSRDISGSKSNGISGSFGAGASIVGRSDINRYSDRDNNDVIDRVVYSGSHADRRLQNGALPSSNQLPPIVPTSSSSSSSSSSSLLAPRSQHQTAPVRHELITKLLKEGPLTPMFHIHWDCRTNDIVRQPGYRYEDDSLYENDHNHFHHDEYDDEHNEYVFDNNYNDVAVDDDLDVLDDENNILSEAIASIKHDHLPPRPNSQQGDHFLPSIPSSIPSSSSSSLLLSPSISFSLPVATSLIDYHNSMDHLSTPPSRLSSAFKSANSTTTTSTSSASTTFTTAPITGAATAAATVALRTSTPSSRISTAASKIISNLIPPNIAVTNIENWHIIEEKIFQELYAIGYQIEKNKINTKVRY